MKDPTDAQLLRAYAEQRSEPAFAELVRRHLDHVYSAALRMVGNSHQAEDVAQGVFLALAQQASSLRQRPILSGWLHRTAQNIAAQTVRGDVRRRVREQEAAAMNELLAAESSSSWEQIAAHLDAALGELSEADRDAVMFRYFEKKSASEMAALLGVSDEAAQKRVSRAVERLREFFTKRGITVGAGGLVIIISVNAVQAAPVGLALTISTAAVLTGTTLATTATITATKATAMTALQKTIVTATVAVLAGAGVYEARQVTQLREQVQTLQQQQAPMVDLIQQLQGEQAQATSRLATLREDNERLTGNSAELLKLRGEVGMLRRQADEVERLRQDNLALQHLVQTNNPPALNLVKTSTVANVYFTRIQQPQTVSDEMIRTNISVKAGDAFSRLAVDADVRRLFDTGWFYNIKVAEDTSTEGITLNYLLQEKPRLTQIRFSGNQRFDEAALALLVSSKAGRSADERTFLEDAQRIQALYSQLGLPNPKVKTLFNVNESRGEGALTFEIVE